MKYDLNGIRSELAEYDVNMTLRPDNSVILTVVHNGKRLMRVIDTSITTQEVIRLIKFDMTLDADSGSIAEAVKHCNNDLPTYSREPIFRTLHSRLWAIRKLKNQ
ncbi:hypothetical protein [Ectopseudomonas mendocina]|jgi:hypothetical protein|uniref:DUF3509 domain-containing protein n=1 Tax=Ectopseudomonas mendocina TaxID=300 RepID=A0A2R3QUX9_ECTME|nr:hypothetical protein [Pseudomonas mendocina]AVO55595.1 hypothetical protein C7A17_23510 [Pseudomonas mendocina]